MKGVRILFIDDDEDDREFISAAVKMLRNPVEFSFAHNGAEAISLLSDENDTLPDYIFSDINMPLMGGFEFLKSIKASSLLKHIPVIIFTTGAGQGIKEEAKHLGASEFITKPNTVREIAGILERFVMGGE